jgi:hypothetical protein
MSNKKKEAESMSSVSGVNTGSSSAVNATQQQQDKKKCKKHEPEQAATNNQTGTPPAGAGQKVNVQS